ILKKRHVVARIGSNNLSRHHRDSGDLVRLEALHANAGFGGRLTATLRHPPGSRLTGRNNDFLTTDAERHLTGKLHHRRRVSRLLEIVLSLSRLNETTEISGI